MHTCNAHPRERKRQVHANTCAHVATAVSFTKLKKENTMTLTDGYKGNATHSATEMNLENTLLNDNIKYSTVHKIKDFF